VDSLALWPQQAQELHRFRACSVEPVGHARVKFDRLATLQYQVVFAQPAQAAAVTRGSVGVARTPTATACSPKCRWRRKVGEGEIALLAERAQARPNSRSRFGQPTSTLWLAPVWNSSTRPGWVGDQPSSARALNAVVP